MLVIACGRSAQAEALMAETMATGLDPDTGQRYTATPGQRFRSAEGVEYVISDVRPNQIVIENVSDGTVQTLPLKGPRG